MTRGGAAPVTDLPAGTDWEFGGFTYGLEPLVLPSVGDADAMRHGDPAADGSVDGYADACRLVRLLGFLTSDMARSSRWRSSSGTWRSTVRSAAIASSSSAAARRRSSK